MKIVIDHREPEQFQNLFDEDDISTAHLGCGDYLIDDLWLFERKTVKDLCISLVDGRLFKQALHLVQSEYHPVVILEGCSSDIKECGIRREAVQGALITLTVFFGLPGVGAKRAEALLKHFGGIEAVMSASEKELTEVDGVGLPIAEKIRNLVCEAEVPYKTKNN